MNTKKKVKYLRIFKSELPGFTTKKIGKRKNRPGEHPFFNNKKTAVQDVYKSLLKNKQKLKILFCINDRQLKNYIKIVLGFNKVTPYISLYNLLCARFDYLIYKLHLAKTILEARQMITHGVFRLDGIKETRPGYICCIDSYITTNSRLARENFINYSDYRVHFNKELTIIDNVICLKIVKPKLLDLHILSLVKSAFEFYL